MCSFLFVYHMNILYLGKSDTPIYSEDQGKCITQDECENISTPPVMRCSVFSPCPDGIECNVNGICEIPIPIPIPIPVEITDDEGEQPGAIPPGFG